MADQAAELEPPSGSPEASARRWKQEFQAAKDELKGWHETAEECDRRYRDEERTNNDGDTLNLYAAGIDLKVATLYGNTPTVDVARRYNDQNDEVARVASELLERLLNGDLERDEEEFPRAIGSALLDWQLADLGDVWFRYEQYPDGEDVCCDYVYWKDTLHSPCRVFSQMRWRARRALLSKKSFQKKFGTEEMPPFAIGGSDEDKRIPKTPWARYEVWEIWDKDAECVWFYVDTYERMLVPVGVQANPDGSIPDPLGIPGFWPFPEMLITGATNSKLVPRPQYARSQDQYAAIDDETTRIGLLRDAVKVAGVYDSTVGELGGLLDGSENAMKPATNYKALAEKGGIAACIAWLPLEAITAALQVLRDLRREDIELLFQVDGTSDIMRGQATEAGATATEQAIKAKYGSIRGDRSQKRFARFCSDAQRIRGYIICKHFAPETIAARANVQGLPPEDQQRAQDAIALLKSDASRFRISVKAESVSLTDYAANKQEAMDVIGGIGAYLQAVAPLAQAAPQLGPQVLQLLTVFISRIKGGDAAEPILDQMVEQVEALAQQAAAQAAQGPQADPTEQVKQQTEMVKAGAEQNRAQADIAKTGMEMQQAQAEHAMNTQALEAEVRADALKTALGASEPQKGI